MLSIAMLWMMQGWVTQVDAPIELPPLKARAVSRQVMKRGMPQLMRQVQPEVAQEARDDSSAVASSGGRGGSRVMLAQATAVPAGSSTAVRNTSSSASGAATRPSSARYKFEFFKAEVMDIVKAISDISGKNFIVPNSIKGKRVTILSPSTISAAEAYQVFLTALAINGITIVRSGRFYKLLESRNAVKSPIPTCIGEDEVCPKYSDRMVTQLIRLSYLEVSQLTSIVKTLLSRAGTLTSFQPSNALIISEYAPNLQRILRIIAALDVAGFKDSLHIVNIEYANATDIVSMISQIYDISGGKKTTARKPGSKDDAANIQISKVVADERTNQIIIKANQSSFEVLKAFIQKLDVPISEADEGRIHVYYLENAKAEDLSSTLSSLAQGANSSSRTPRRVMKKAVGQASSSAVLFEGEVKITADKATNSLIIVASAHDYRSLRKLIEKLDRARRQVYVEAAILEVSASDSEDMFLHWHAPGNFSENDIGSTLGGDGTVGFLQSGPFSSPESGISPTLLGSNLLSAVGGAITGIVGKSFSIPGTDLSVPSFGVVLNWLKKDSHAQILSTPHVLTMDNEEASIEVGKKIPFRRGTSIPQGLGSLAGLGGSGSSLQSLSGMSNLFSATDRIDVKMKLSFTPQITAGNRIRLEVEQHIEDVVGTDGSTGQPITSNRSLKTVVMVEDQQTVVLGGLIRDNVTEGESKVPILGDLPIIGWFFRSRTSRTEKVNLLLVLTPYIINETSDFQGILQRKMEEHEEFAASYYGHLSTYRAHIDYARKVGPLGRLIGKVRYEMDKIENGGDGSGSTTLISPQLSHDAADEPPHGKDPERPVVAPAEAAEEGVAP